MEDTAVTAIAAAIQGIGFVLQIAVASAVILFIVFIYKKFILPKINKTKDIASAISNHGTKAIKDYVDKHAHSNAQFSSENDNVFYEQAMTEIEEDTKVRGTWAKALANSDGNIDKAKSLYIQMRVQSLKIESTKDNIKINHDKDLIRATALAKFTEEYNLYNFKKIDENTYDALQQNNKIIIKYFEGPNRWRFHHRY